MKKKFFLLSAIMLSGVILSSLLSCSSSEEIEQLVLHPERIPILQQQSIVYVKKHHDYLKVAQQYLDFYQTL